MSREPNRARASRIRPNRAGPHRAESDRADRTERTGAVRPSRSEPHQTEPNQSKPDRSRPIRAVSGQAGPIKPYWPNQSEPSRTSRDRSNRAGSNLSEPYRPEPDTSAAARLARSGGAQNDRPSARRLRACADDGTRPASGNPSPSNGRARLRAPVMQTETSRKLFGSVRLAALERRANANHHANRLPRIRPFPPRSSARHRASIHRQRSGLAQTPQLQTPECASCPCRAPNGPRASPHRRIV